MFNFISLFLGVFIISFFLSSGICVASPVSTQQYHKAFIYPEEIEQKLNNLPYVNESIVIERDGKIIALVHPDYDLAQSQGLTDDDIKKQMDDNIAALNKEIPAYSQVAAVEIHEEEFEKTPKRSIRRFLYK